jgi:putative transposase
MKVEISVPEVVSFFKEIQQQPEKVLEMIRLDVREMVGRYLTEMMEAELTHFLGREPYERKDKDSNHRNGSYGRRFTIKSIGRSRSRSPGTAKGSIKPPSSPVLSNTRGKSDTIFV